MSELLTRKEMAGTVKILSGNPLYDGDDVGLSVPRQRKLLAYALMLEEKLKATEATEDEKKDEEVSFDTKGTTMVQALQNRLYSLSITQRGLIADEIIRLREELEDISSSYRRSVKNAVEYHQEVKDLATERDGLQIRNDRQAEMLAASPELSAAQLNALEMAKFLEFLVKEHGTKLEGWLYSVNAYTTTVKLWATDLVSEFNTLNEPHPLEFKGDTKALVGRAFNAEDGCVSVGGGKSSAPEECSAFNALAAYLKAASDLSMLKASLSTPEGYVGVVTEELEKDRDDWAMKCKSLEASNKKMKDNASKLISLLVVTPRGCLGYDDQDGHAYRDEVLNNLRESMKP